jgi:hypothetical protein
LFSDYKEEMLPTGTLQWTQFMRAAVILMPLLSVAVALSADSNDANLIVKPDAFKTLVNPKCSHCRDEAKRRVGELQNRDRVLCWIRGYSDGGAIPLRFFLNPYRVISDSYGVFVLDPDAGFMRGFAPSYDFSFYGWRHGVMVMKHKDGTLYSCLSGRAFAGPRKGTRLEPVPTLESDWGFWLKAYPGGVAYHMFDKYQPVDLPTGIDANSSKSRLPEDGRLPAEKLVLGVTDAKEARAYPLDLTAKTGLVTEVVAGRRCVVLWYAPTRTAAAYELIASAPVKAVAPGAKAPPPPKDLPAPRAVTLEVDASADEAPFRDKETGSRWDIAGRAVEGQFKGWTLTWRDGVQVKWYAWAAEYPGSTIFGK